MYRVHRAVFRQAPWWGEKVCGSTGQYDYTSFMEVLLRHGRIPPEEDQGLVSMDGEYRLVKTKTRS